MMTTRTVTTTVHHQPPQTMVAPVAVRPYAPAMPGTQPQPQHSLSRGTSFANPKITKFEISFETDSERLADVFFTGETLRGHVVLHIKKPLRALRVQLQCVGLAKLGNMTRKILNEKFFVFGSEQAKTNQIIPVGAHSFPFSVDLLSSLLPSVECKGHFVKFYCKAKIVRHLDKNTIDVERPFDVYQDNSNVYEMIANQQEPVNCPDITTGDLIVSYQLQKTGFTMGETPVVEGEIYNRSKSPVQVKVGMDCARMIKICGSVHLGVTQVACRESTTVDGFGDWSSLYTVPGNGELPFTFKLNLGCPPPTTSCLEVEINHILRVKVLREKKFSISAVKPKVQEHPIVLGRSDAPVGGMRRNTSRISMGKASLRRKAPSLPPSTDSSFNNSWSKTANTSEQSSITETKKVRSGIPSGSPPPYSLY